MSREHNNSCVRIHNVVFCYFHADGKPGDIQTLTAIPLSQSELQVIWLPPDPLGTTDPLLLRYNVCYTEKDSMINMCKNVTPQLPDNEIKLQLTNLSKGHTYEISAVAISMLTTMFPSFSRHSALASTYGIGKPIYAYVHVQKKEKRGVKYDLAILKSSFFIASLTCVGLNSTLSTCMVHIPMCTYTMF